MLDGKPVNRRPFLLSLAGLAFSGALGSRLFSSHETFKIHRIRKGDTLSELAQKYGTTVAAIRRANDLKNNRIIAGQRLRIPVSHKGAADFQSITKSLRIKEGRWKFVVAHHSATPNGNATIYGKNHLRRGMRDGLAYHFVIGNGIDSGDGEIEVGPRWRKQLRGGHVKSAIYNEYGIGVCFVGNFMKTRPTKNQVASFHRLMETLRAEALSGDYTLTAHKLIPNEQTVCPGRHFPLENFLDTYRA